MSDFYIGLVDCSVSFFNPDIQPNNSMAPCDAIVMYIVYYIIDNYSKTKTKTTKKTILLTFGAKHVLQ